MKLLKQGVWDMVRIPGARMRDTSYGTVVPHIGPEAANGGPLVLVENGVRSGSMQKDTEWI